VNPYPPLPEEIEACLAQARRLEWWTLFWLGNIVVVMYLTMGGSQAMQAAWIEDALSLAPPVLFLAAVLVQRLPPSPKFPFGLHRAGTLAFLLSATALIAMGGFLVVDAAVFLARQQHPTVGSIELFGQQVWMGWVMIAALAYSIVPPVLIARKKKRIARRLKDKILFTDAAMNAADWKTGGAGILGILGIAYGYWWADAVAAGLIGLDIVYDGWRTMRRAVAELLDGAPRQLEGDGLQEVVARAEKSIGKPVKLREAGRYLHVLVGQTEDLRPDPDRAQVLFGEDAWRVVSLAEATPVSHHAGWVEEEEEEEPQAPEA
jgi:cation diffusion facilitator family transporter